MGTERHLSSIDRVREIKNKAIEFLRAKNYSKELIDHNVNLFYNLTLSLNGKMFKESLSVEPINLITLSLYHNVPSVKKLPHDVRQSIGDLLSVFLKLKDYDNSDGNEKWHYYSELACNNLPILIFRTVDISILPLHRETLIRVFNYDKRTVDRTMKSLAESMLYAYAPYASMLGLHGITVNLRNSAASVLYPSLYVRVVEEIEKNRDKLEFVRSSFSEDIENLVRESIVDRGIRFVPLRDDGRYGRGRIKQPGSITLKLVARNMGFEEIFSLHDLVAFTVVTKTIEDSYAFLEVVREKMGNSIVSGEDYIAKPRPNGYQALHVDLNYYSNVNVELQIRTKEMHDRCEHGDLMHALYKPHKLQKEILYNIRKYSNLLSEVTTEQIQRIADGMHGPKVKVCVEFENGRMVEVELPEKSCVFDLVCEVSEPSNRPYEVVLKTTGKRYSLFDIIDDNATYIIRNSKDDNYMSHRTIKSLENVCKTQKARLALRALAKNKLHK